MSDDLTALFAQFEEEERLLAEQIANANQRSVAGHVPELGRSIAQGFTGAMGSGIQGIETILRDPERPKGWLSSIGQSIEQAVPPNPVYASAPAQQIGQALGSMAAFVGTGAVAGPAAVAALGAGAGVSETERAMREYVRENPEAAAAQGIDERHINEFAGRYGVIPGLSELLTVQTILRKVPGAQAGSARYFARRMAEAGIAEYTASATARVLQNDIAAIYNPEVTDILKGAHEEGMTGGAAAVLMEALLIPFRRRGATPAATPPAADPLLALPPPQGKLPAPDGGMPDGYKGPGPSAIDSIIERYGDGDVGEQAWLDWVSLIADAEQRSPEAAEAVRTMLDLDPDLNLWTNGGYEIEFSDPGVPKPGMRPLPATPPAPSGLLDKILSSPTAASVLDDVISQSASRPDYTVPGLLDRMIDRAQEMYGLTLDMPLSTQTSPQQRQAIGTELARVAIRQRIFNPLGKAIRETEARDMPNPRMELGRTVQDAQAEAAQTPGDALDQAATASQIIAERLPAQHRTIADRIAALRTQRGQTARAPVGATEATVLGGITDAAQQQTDNTAIEQGSVGDASTALSALALPDVAAAQPTDPLDVGIRPGDAPDVDALANEAATSPLNNLPEPTPAQQEAGNYRKGKVTVQGLPITIENPKGSTRSGKAPDGRKWSTTMKQHYGYIRRTEGADGEQVDVFVGDKPDSDKVFVIDQVDQATGKFDEHKAMLGFPNRLAAERAYRSNYQKGWKVGPVTEMSTAEFKAWLAEPRKAPAAEPRKQPGDDGYTLLDARNDLMDMRTQAEAQGRVADARLLERIRRQEALVKEMEAEALPSLTELQPARARFTIDTLDGPKKVFADRLQLPWLAIRTTKVRGRDHFWVYRVDSGKGVLLADGTDRALVIKNAAQRDKADKDRAQAAATPEPQWWQDMTGAKRADVLQAIGLTPSAKTKWSSLSPENQKALDAQWGTKPKNAPLPPDSGSAAIDAFIRGDRPDAPTIEEVDAEQFGKRWDAMGYGGREAVAQKTRSQRAVVHRLAGSKWAEVSPGERADLMAAEKAAPAPQVSANTLFTDDAAEEARKVLREILGGQRPSMGLDPRLVQAGITLAGYHIERGARTFAAYSKAMLADMGDSIKPYLRSWYEGVRYYPGFDATGMTPAADIIEDVTDGRAEDTTASDGPTGTGRSDGQRDGDVQPDDGGRAASSDQSSSDAGPRESVAADTADDRGAEPDTDGSVDPGNGAAPGYADYRIQPGELKREGSWKKTAERNVEIVELIARLEADKRQATPEEKALLVKFTGWGASEIANGVFPNQWGNYKDDNWKALGERLKAAMSDAEYAQAKRTTQYAHYTSEEVVRTIYDALGRLGFSGGKILEPGMGSGNFKGLMPSGIAARSQYTGIEYDTFTSKIAAQLYPKSRILNEDYTKTALPRDFFDAAIGNPPFSSTKVTGDPEYKRQGFMLHDYFFAKTVDRVRPGGLLVFVTSKGTMDKAGQRARKYIADRADLLGAVRLPQTAFKENAGTEVVTDVLFFQRRGEGVEPNGVKWMGLEQVKAQGGAQVSVNEYFAANPHMVLGEHSTAGSMYRADEYTVVPRPNTDIITEFARAIESLPTSVYKARRSPQALQAAAVERDFNPSHRKEGGLYVDQSGQLRSVEQGSGVAVTARRGAKGEEIALTDKQVAWLKDYVGVRDALKQSMYEQLNDGNWEAALRAVNKKYDAFVKAHGHMLAFTESERENADGTTTVTRRFKNNALMNMDAEGALIHALEAITEDGKIIKAPALGARTLNKPKTAQVKTTVDAMFVTLNELGTFNLDSVAERAGVTPKQAIQELGDLIYEDPAKGWVMADEYLSGNVVRKLQEAETAAKLDARYARNAEALRAVQPPRLASSDIYAALGAHWVPASDMQAFAREVLKTDKLSIRYNADGAVWEVDGDNTKQVSDWSSGARSTRDILDAVLNNRTLKVSSKDGEGRTVVDAEATAILGNIAQSMRKAFGSWIWADKARAERLVDYYNDNFNNIQPRAYDGSHLTLPGVSMRFNLHPHQKRAIWRAILDGKVYFAHAVGAGKTFTMISAGMEERRLGLAKKPMYVVPNHMLAQFSKEFLELYPAANIMVADETNFHTGNRRRFVAQAALNDPDAIVITHSAFKLIGLSPETNDRFIQEQIDELRAALQEASEADRITVKRIEKQIEALEKRLAGQLEGAAKDKVLTFEELGVDRLYVDEAHEFRKLDIATSRANLKGVDPKGSYAALDLFVKSRYLEEINPGRGIAFASGTPITNTMGELYTVQRFFQLEQMREEGIDNFDAWATQFGTVSAEFEPNPAGGYQIVERFSKFVNIADLMSRVRQFMDVLTTEQLGALVVRPKVKGGQRRVKVTPTPDGFKEYQKLMGERIDAIKARKGPPSPGDDIMLTVITDGRLAALDMRFVDPSRPSDPNSKLNIAIDDILAAYNETAEAEYHTANKIDAKKGSSIIVFTDLGLGDQVAETRGFNMREWMRKRLVEGGVKPEHIAFMREHKQHAKKARLFADMREGRKRILIGGKDMETGVNVQKRLTHLIHIDTPWLPAAVEQREGRALRQGNQNKEIDIEALATKGSYDSQMLSTIARKAGFIELALKGDRSLRQMEDVSEASNFQIAAALASGDQRFMQLAGLRSEVMQLELQQSAHARTQNELAHEQWKLRGSLNTWGSLIPELKAILKRRKDVRAGEFSGTVEGVTFDNRDEFSAALHAKFKALAESETTDTLTLGNLAGIDIKYHGVQMGFSKTFIASLDMAIPRADALLEYPTAFESTPVNGIATRAVNQAMGIERRISAFEQMQREDTQRLEQVESKLGAPFSDLGELREKRAQADALEAELAADKGGDGTPAEPMPGDPTGRPWTKAEREPPLDSRFKRSTPKGGMTRDAVQAVVDRVNLGATKITAVDSVADLPADVRAWAKSQNALGDMDAIYFEGQVYIVASRMADANAVEAAILHEVVAHLGMRALLGEGLDAYLQRVYMAMGNSPEAADIKARYFDADRPFNPKDKKHRAEVAEELIAHIAESAKHRTLWNKLVSFVRDTLRAMGFKRPLAEADILAMLRRAEATVRRDDAQARGGAAMSRQTPTIEVDGVQRPTLNSDGRPIHSTDEGVRNFWRWFGDSKVVDAQGRPLVVYHGTSRDFDTFSKGKQGSATLAEDAKGAFFFTSDRKAAEDFAGYIHYTPDGVNVEQRYTDGANVMPVYLKAQKPGMWQMYGAAYKEGWLRDAIREAKKDKEDAVVFANMRDGSVSTVGPWTKQHVFAVFSPNQIKSAIGNTGQFSRNSDDIRFSRGRNDYTAENARFREEHKTVWKRAGRLTRRLFAPGGLLSEFANGMIFQGQQLRDNTFRATEYQIRNAILDLQRAYKAAYKQDIDKATPDQMERMHESLAGRMDTSLPFEVQAALVAMRKEIDLHSAEYKAILLDKLAGTMLAGADAVALGKAVAKAKAELDAAVAASRDAALLAARDNVAAKLRERVAAKRAMKGVPRAQAAMLQAAYDQAVRAHQDAKKAYRRAMPLDIRAISDKLTGLRADVAAAYGASASVDTQRAMYDRIKNNIGSYVHRSYKAYDDPKWFEKVDNATINAAREYMIKGYRLEGDTQAEAEAQAEVALELIKTGTAADSLDAFISEGKLGMKDLSVLIRRKNVPKEIRDLLGEYKDPRINFAKSVTKTSRLVGNHRFLERVREMGMGTIFFDKPTTEARVQFAADASEAYAPLNGLWTTPELLQAFKDAMGTGQESWWIDEIIRLNGMIKYGKTVLSPTTAMRNFWSGAFMLMANGHFSPTAIKYGVRAVRDHLGRSDNEANRAYIAKLIRLGVAHNTTTFGEMHLWLQDSRIEQWLQAKGEGWLNGFRKANDIAKGFYSFGDDFYKIMGFENIKADLMKGGMIESAAEAEAAKRVIAMYPTYSMVGMAGKWLSRFPLAGTFISFPAEIIRTTYNMVEYTISDLKSGDPALRAMGAKRAVGLTLASGAIYAASALTKAMLGIGDDEEEAIRTMAAPWQKNSTFIYTGRDANGNLRYFDFTFMDPYGYWKRPFTAFMSDRPWREAFSSSASDLLTPFFGADITAGTIFEIAANKKESGGKVYREGDDALSQTADIANHLRKGLQPGVFNNVERTLYAATETRKQGFGQPYQLGDEALALVGFRASTLDPKAALFYRSFDYVDRLKEARQDLMRGFRSGADMTEVNVAANRKAATGFREMHNIARAAMASGLSEQETRAVLQQGAIPRGYINAILRGETPEISLNSIAVRRAIRQAEVMLSKERADELRRNYRELAK